MWSEAGLSRLSSMTRQIIENPQLGDEVLGFATSILGKLCADLLKDYIEKRELKKEIDKGKQELLDDLYGEIRRLSRRGVRTHTSFPDKIPWLKGGESKKLSAKKAHDATIEKLIKETWYKDRLRKLRQIVPLPFKYLKEEPLGYFTFGSRASTRMTELHFAKWYEQLDLRWELDPIGTKRLEEDPSEVRRWATNEKGEVVERSEVFRYVKDYKAETEEKGLIKPWVLNGDLEEDIFVETLAPNFLAEGTFHEGNRPLVNASCGLYGPGTAAKELLLDDSEILGTIWDEVQRVKPQNLWFQVLLRVKVKRDKDGITIPFKITPAGSSPEEWIHILTMRKSKIPRSQA